MNYLEKAQAILSDAESYYVSAKTLSQRCHEDHGRATAMLKLLAFELALKAAFVLDQNKDARKTHDYPKIWQGLKPATQVLILEMAGTEVGTIDGTNELRYETSRLEQKLERWKEAFTEGRYSFSKNLNRSKKQIQDVGKKWIADGCPDEDADYEYGGEDLYGLYSAIIKWCNDRIAS